ncbi:MAG: hypothetical protein JO345_08395 [Streptosporangiaceae bacterium]|nr:hypothetical protein [Streptosporangiaceae bacterium]
MAERRPGELPVSLCYVDDPSGTVIIGIPDASPPLIDQYLRMFRHRIGAWPRMDEALTFLGCGPAFRHAKKTEYNRPLAGGLYITNPTGQGAKAQGTICIAAKHGGNAGFVTAGHVADQNGTTFYQPRQSSVNDWMAGTTSAVTAFLGQASSDSAFLAAATLQSTSTQVGVQYNSIWKNANSNYTVTGVAAPPTVGDQVSMQGAALLAERNGQIAAVDATIAFQGGGTLDHQLLATYQSREGDSGAPVYRKLNDPNVELIGLNVGAVDTSTMPNPVTLPQNSPPLRASAKSVIA